MNLKCTKKLLDKLKIKNPNILEDKTDKDIENWHCNIFDYGKIYAVLITNDNRGVLASMNQMLPYIHNRLEREMDLLDINIGLNKIINSKLNWKKPRDEFESLLSSCIYQ